ncbi:MAG: hypothetical protein IJH38_08165 [Clostridia bacterium]|nr:hypothetical protein [Clostridia bacterium]
MNWINCCPLRSIGSRMDEPCLEEKCAWFLLEQEICAIAGFGDAAYCVADDMTDKKARAQ